MAIPTLPRPPWVNFLMLADLEMYTRTRAFYSVHFGDDPKSKELTPASKFVSTNIPVNTTAQKGSVVYAFYT